MFTRVEVKNFRSLRDVSVPLSNFHVLVGANGSGKTTFLDAFAFMGDLINEGLKAAMHKRNVRWQELVTSNSKSKSIKFSFEALIPEGTLEGSRLGSFDSLRYEIFIQFNFTKEHELEILGETCYLFKSNEPPQAWRKQELSQDDTLNDILGIDRITDLSQETKAVEILRRDRQTCDAITNDELLKWELRIGWDVTALEKLQEDSIKFPATTWLKNQFKKFIQPIQIESDAINKAGKEGRPGTVNPDGSNLPWLIASLKSNAPDRYKLWMKHIQTVLPEIKSIKTVLREDQNDMFLKIKYKEGNEVKQWMVSDGTLRLLLLTIIPYPLEMKGLFLIEEPEIGINPLAIQAIMDSLRSFWEEQVFVTTHSPEAVNCVRKKDLLIFSKNAAGETQIVSGTEHPGLTNWKMDLGSGVFYGAGIMR